MSFLPRRRSSDADIDTMSTGVLIQEVKRRRRFYRLWVDPAKLEEADRVLFSLKLGITNVARAYLKEEWRKKSI